MKRLLVSAALVCLLAVAASAQSHRIQTADGTVKGPFSDLVVPNGSLTKLTSGPSAGKFQITFSGVTFANFIGPTQARNITLDDAAQTLARRDAGQTFVGNEIFNGSVAIGAGTPILKVISATASLDFAAWSGGDCQDLTVTVTGAADGNVVSIGVPLALASTAGLAFSGFVSAADTVTIRGCKITSGASANPAAATVRATVIQH